MKKFLAMLMALCMIMSCMTIVTFAEDAAEEKPETTRIKIDAGDFSGGNLVETPDEMMVSTITGKVGVGGMMFYWFTNQAKKDVEVPVFDISQMEYMEISVYFSDITHLEGKQFCFELTSGGTCDVQEDCLVTTWPELATLAGATLQNGWNDLKVPLTAWPSAGADRTRINCFRFFCNTPFEIPEGEKIDYNFRKIAWGKADGTEQVLEFNTDFGLGGSVSRYDYPSTRTWNITAGQAVAGGGGLITSWTGDPMDLSNFKFMNIRARITNRQQIKNIKFQVELTSGGACDVEESSYEGYFNNIGEGWTTITIPISAFTRGGAAKMSAINYVRMYTMEGEIVEDTSFELAYVEFSDEAAVNFKTYSFLPGKEQPLPENVTLSVNQPCGEQGWGLFADANGSYVWEIDLENIDPSYIYLTCTLAGNEPLLQVAEQNDPSAFVNIFDAEKAPAGGRGTYVINVGSYLAMSKFKPAGYKLYFRLGDHDDSDGNGGQLLNETPITFSVGYSEWKVADDYVEVTDEMLQMDIDEMLRTEHSVPLFGCSTEIAGFTLDYKDFKNGCSSLVFKLGTYEKAGEEVTTNGQSGFAFKTEDFAGEEFINAEGMDTLEFWFYVSDIDALNAISFQDNALELTSAGTYDQEETCWRLANIMEQVTAPGWNAIRLPFSSGAGSTNWANLNFMRWYFINGTNLPEGDPVVIKIDDIRLTDYEAQQKELQKPVAEAMGAKINEKLGQIPEWDDENDEIVAQYDANKDAWTAAYDEVKAEFDALNSIAQDLVADAGDKKLMTSVGRWLKNYNTFAEKRANTPVEPPVDTPDDPVDTPDDPVDTPDDPVDTPDDPVDTPDTPDEGGNGATVIIIVVVAVVVVAAAVVVFLIIKKKKA